MSFNQSIFKAYDIRGIVPDELNEEFAYRLGGAYARYVSRLIQKQPLRIAVGKDNRLSSDMLTASLIRGLCEAGCDVVDIGLASTPQFDFAVSELELEGGIMVTASHNPPQYNGFKLMGPGITPIGGDSGMQEIKALLQEDCPPAARVGSISHEDLLDRYISRNLELIPPLDGVRKLKIVVDTGNGVSGIMCKAYLDRLGISYIPLFFELDGTFPSHLPNPLVEENIRVLQQTVVNEKADLGAALDTDGDRIVLVDENGKMTNDILTALLAQGFLSLQPGEKILYDIRSSHAVPETITRSGGIPVATPVGHTLIKQAMKKEGGVFAGELSGHYYFRDMSRFEAPLLVLTLVLNLLVTSQKKLSDLVSPLRTYFGTGEVNFKVEDKTSAIKRLEGRYADANVSYLDGITIEYADWWCNVRASNTENVLRLNLEASTENLRDEKRKEVESIIESSL